MSYDLLDVPSVQRVLPGLSGKFTLSHSADGKAFCVWDGDEVYVVAHNISTQIHEIAHAVVIRGWEPQAKEATQAQHEAAATVIERAVVRGNRHLMEEWHVRLRRQHPDVQALYSEGRRAGLPLAETVSYILRPGRANAEA